MNHISQTQIMTNGLQEDIKMIAPCTQIAERYGKEFLENQNKENVKLEKPFSSLPVDFEIQDLLKKSSSEENILKIKDLKWLPWM